MPKLPPLDAYSFIAGALFGFVFYYLVIVKKIVHHIIRISKNIYERIAASANLDKAESLINKSLFNQAQANHVFAHVTPLESILIKPKLLFPPKYLYPEFYTTSSSLINQFFPFTPDWPELSAQYPVDNIDYTHLAHINGKTLIIGQPGSGKTTLLAALVISMLQDSSSEKLPIYVSAKTILPLLEKEQDPMEILTAAFSEGNPQITASQIYFILKSKISTQNAILLLDDVDHLYTDEIEQVLGFLTTLETEYQFTKFIIAADPNSIGKELTKHFFPLTIASWSVIEQRNFISAIQDIWDSCKFSNKNDSVKPIQAPVLTKWLQDDTPYYSPFDLVVRIWLLNSGSSLGFNIADHLINVLDLFALSKDELEGIALLAYSLLRSHKSSMDIPEANEYLSSVEQSLEYFDPLSKSEIQETTPSTKYIHTISSKTLQSAQIITIDSFDRISFSSPIWAGFFANLIISPDIQNWFPRADLNWTYSSQYLRFATINNYADSWYESIFKKETPFPFDNTYLKLARFIPDLAFDHPVRNGILKWLAKSSFQNQLPAAERAQLFAALLVSKDPSVPKLLLEFQSMPDPDLRFLSILTYAAFANSESFNVFMDHLADEEQNVRNAASLAFYALNNKKSSDLLIDILLQGDEYMKQTAAESLAVIDGISQDLLTEAIASEDLLIRRAAVYGLSRIPDQWALDILSHAAIEDGQWIVRNAATQVIENQDVFKTMLIPQLPHPSNAPWLISFASKLGKGIPKSGFVKDILMSALDQGNVDEKISAMNYLRIVPDSDIINAIFPLLVHKNRSMQQASAIALWYIEKILGGIPMQKEKRLS
ncbi:MAG: HEAT repeat domain-containing protein [Anaerolineaceae bacterium]|nr:HEAT repeat domain-containing protein [Anaerolineaceae bacterium]